MKNDLVLEACAIDIHKTIVYVNMFTLDLQGIGSASHKCRLKP